MSSDVSTPPESPPTRDELVTMVGRAHGDSAYSDSTLTGRLLAAQSKLPRVIAENLGAGFGQWDFFPEAADIVDFALGYVPPATEDDVWTMARAWASDDAASRHTLLALVGREILQHELRRIEIPKLRELFSETRANRIHALRTELGLAVSAAPISKPETTRKAAPRAERAPVEKREIPTRMPKPEFKKPAKAAPPPAQRRFQHPKFGEGVLESQNGEGAEAKLTIKFASGSKTLQAQYVTELV
jgi:hypothetical protein